MIYKRKYPIFVHMRLFDILYQYQEKFSKNDCLAKKEGGKWVTYSTKEYVELSEALAKGLISMGVQREDKIAILSNNRPEWNICDMGVQMSGAVLIPIYPTISEKDLDFILKDAEVKYVFVSADDIYKKVRSVANGVPSVKEIYSFNQLAGVKNWMEVVEKGRTQDGAAMESMKRSIKESDLATILYTSGTTGTPKGVMLSHSNIFSNVHAVRNLPPCDHTSRALSFLPLNHIYERMLTYMYMYLGISIYYAESLETIGDNLREVKPHIFSCVPRLLEKVYDKIVSKGAELTGVKKFLFFWALELGEKYQGDGKGGWWYQQQLALANKLIFSKWREALGGNVRAAVSGGAALNPRLARIFWAAQIPILEGYGLTETSPVIAVNNFEKGGMKFGTVGPLIEKVEVKIAEDGEILSRGPHIMMGYYKRPDATAEVIDKDGYFHTGDIGIMDEGKYLKITDRKKEIFKTSGGKYIAPQMIENKIKECPYVEQVMVIGENQKFAAALIVPSFVKIKDKYAKEGKKFSTNEEAVRDPEIMGIIKTHIETMNKGLAQYETIKKFELLPREWTIDRGEMTPKLSLKRKVISESQKALIDRIFS